MNITLANKIALRFVIVRDLDLGSRSALAAIIEPSKKPARLLKASRAFCCLQG
jgi:hypothetical protein